MKRFKTTLLLFIILAQTNAGLRDWFNWGGSDDQTKAATPAGTEMNAAGSAISENPIPRDLGVAGSNESNEAKSPTHMQRAIHKVGESFKGETDEENSDCCIRCASCCAAASVICIPCAPCCKAVDRNPKYTFCGILVVSALAPVLYFTLRPKSNAGSSNVLAPAPPAATDLAAFEWGSELTCSVLMYTAGRVGARLQSSGLPATLTNIGTLFGKTLNGAANTTAGSSQEFIAMISEFVPDNVSSSVSIQDFLMRVREGVNRVNGINRSIAAPPTLPKLIRDAEKYLGDNCVESSIKPTEQSHHASSKPSIIPTATNFASNNPLPSPSATHFIPSSTNAASPSVRPSPNPSPSAHPAPTSLNGATFNPSPTGNMNSCEKFLREAIEKSVRDELSKYSPLSSGATFPPGFKEEVAAQIKIQTKARLDATCEEVTSCKKPGCPPNTDACFTKNTNLPPECSPIGLLFDACGNILGKTFVKTGECIEPISPAPTSNQPTNCKDSLQQGALGGNVATPEEARQALHEGCIELIGCNKGEAMLRCASGNDGCYIQGLEQAPLPQHCSSIHHMFDTCAAVLGTTFKSIGVCLIGTRSPMPPMTPTSTPVPTPYTDCKSFLQQAAIQESGKQSATPEEAAMLLAYLCGNMTTCDKSVFSETCAPGNDACYVGDGGMSNEVAAAACSTIKNAFNTCGNVLGKTFSSIGRCVSTPTSTPSPTPKREYISNKEKRREYKQEMKERQTREIEKSKK
jgi:hypothetical protein